MSTSVESAAAQDAILFPVAGSSTSKVLPDFASTHLQSENELIAAQQMRLAQDSSPFGSDFILLGDLNHTNADIYLRCKKNNYCRTHDSNRILDYILPMNEKYCDINVEIDNIYLEGVSDHYPLIATFNK